MVKPVIFVDESGTLPDPKDNVIVLAALGTINPEKIETIIKKLLKKSVLRKQTGELKFYTAGDRTKRLFFKSIAKEYVNLFVLVVEKMGKKIPDTPEHFSILSWLLLNDVLSFYQETKEIVFDRHFSTKRDNETFHKRVLQLLMKNIQIKYVDSKKDKGVSSADMIAGAVLAKESGKDTRFYQTIRNKIVSEKRLNWVEAKRMIFNKKLA